MSRPRPELWYYDLTRQLYWCQHCPILIGEEEVEPARRLMAQVWTSQDPITPADVLDWLAIQRIADTPARAPAPKGAL